MLGSTSAIILALLHQNSSDDVYPKLTLNCFVIVNAEKMEVIARVVNLLFVWCFLCTYDVIR